MQIQEVKLSKLKPSDWNPRTIKDKRFKALCKSIEQDPEFLSLRPVLATLDGSIYAGNMRYKACEYLGYETIPCVVSDIPLIKAKERAVKDNNGFGEWDDTYATLLDELEKEGIDLATLGIDEDIEKILANIPEEGLTDEDAVPEVPKESKTKLGDIYELGDHRLMCGDSTSIDAVDVLMGGGKADMVWTDPPYNVAIEGSAGKIMNDDMSDESFYDFCLSFYNSYFYSLKEGGVIYVAHADSERVNFTKAFLESGLKLSQIIIWVKQAFTLSRQDFNWQHEPIIYGWKEGQAHYFCKDFTLSSVIDDDVDFSKLSKKELEVLCESQRNDKKTTIIREDRPSKSELHPTMKPISLVQRMISYSSREGEIVLDLFGGSGSTMVACQKLNRKCYMMELDPKYCDVIVKRWEDFTGQKAKLLTK